MKSILVIDPDRNFADLLKLIIEDRGYGVVGCTSLTEAERLPSSTRFEVIVTEAFDQRDTFAFDPAFLARVNTLAPGATVILASTYTLVTSIRAAELGLAAVLAKPVPLDELEKVLFTALGEEDPEKRG